MNDHDDIFGDVAADFPDFPDFNSTPETLQNPFDTQDPTTQEQEEPTTRKAVPLFTAVTQSSENVLDLGSDDTEPGLPDEDDCAAEESAESVIAGAPTPETTAEPAAAHVLATPVLTKAAPAASVVDDEENPLEAAMNATTFGSVFSTPPVFEYGAVTEDIADTAQTFDALRLAKVEDFPELEDEAKVTWTVTYGKVTKNISQPEAKKKKIGEVKSGIETSKEFMDALKKAKDKSPRCVLKPRVIMQSKGDRLAAYKGVFTSAEEAEQSDKIISIIPGQDGYVYEKRRSEIGVFTTRAANCRELSEVTAGFIPALPRIPLNLLLEVISFFRFYVNENQNDEAIVNVLWDKERGMFCIYAPPQVVTHTAVISDLARLPDSDRYLHFMDIHSHNVMSAKFSGTDDNDEKATRVYAVIGKLDRYMPEISVRISNGGKYLPIDPATVFEPLAREYPAQWHDNVEVLNTESDARRQYEI
jgi:hypothetical protein